MSRNLLKELIEEIILDEINTLASGNVVGYTGPLGMDTTSIHKGFWRGDYKKKLKTSSPKLKKQASDT